MPNEDKILSIDSREHTNIPCSIESVKFNISPQLEKDLNTDKEKIIKQLKKAQSIEDRVKIFAKRTDEYGIEAIISMIPGLQVVSGFIATNYLLAEALRMKLPLDDAIKIIGYQFKDILVGMLPFADFFYKSNEYSADLFSFHLDKLKKAALERGISQKEIDEVTKREERFVIGMNQYVVRESKKTESQKKIKRPKKGKKGKRK